MRIAPGAIACIAILSPCAHAATDDALASFLAVNAPSATSLVAPERGVIDTVPVTPDAGILSIEYIGRHRITWFFDYLDGIRSPHEREALTAVLEVIQPSAAASDDDDAFGPAFLPIDAAAADDQRARRFSWGDNARAVPTPGSGVLALSALAIMAPRRRA